MQELTDQSSEFCYGPCFNKGLNCTEKVKKNPENVFILKIDESPSTLNVPKILTFVNATDAEVFRKS